MEMHISFKHMEPTEAIKQVTREKSEKLGVYFKGRINVSWNFVVENRDHVAHIHLVGNNMDYFAEARSEDLYKSIDQALAKVEKQIRAHKEIVKDHLHHSRTGNE